MEVMDVVPYSTYRVVDGHCGDAQRIIPHPSCMMQGFGIEIACDPCPCGTATSDNQPQNWSSGSQQNVLVRYFSRGTLDTRYNRYRVRSIVDNK